MKYLKALDDNDMDQLESLIMENDMEKNMGKFLVNRNRPFNYNSPNHTDSFIQHTPDSNID